MDAFEREPRMDELQIEREFDGRWAFRQLEISEGWTLAGNRRIHHEWTARHHASGRVLRRRVFVELLEAVRAQDPKLTAATAARVSA
jgi:hypothetical protein